MSPALQAALAQVVPSYMQAVYGERERQVVMAVLEALTGVLRSCGTLTLQPPGRLAELCNVLKAVLQRKVSGASGLQDGEVAWPRWGSSEATNPALPCPDPVERKRGRRAQTELRYLFCRQPVRTLTMTRKKMKIR